uniref:Uncharacterized protein n=1 Tax=Arion vulgaris TaxID=1028688 RepID=A0A0B7ABS5_9EUPU
MDLKINEGKTKILTLNGIRGVNHIKQRGTAPEKVGTFMYLGRVEAKIETTN